MTHTSLDNYFTLNFSLKTHHKWDIHEIENLPIWERDLYVDMLADFLKQKEEEALNG